MSKTPNFKKNRTITDLISDTRKPRVLADTAWYKIGINEEYEIPFMNSWANVGGSGNPDVQFAMDDHGWTRVIGLVDGGAEGTVIFTLPEENRPRYREIFTCAVDGGGTANVSVKPNGDVTLESYNV